MKLIDEEKREISLKGTSTTIDKEAQESLQDDTENPPTKKPTYINEFHREWMESTKKSIEEWKKDPLSLEEVEKQQQRLNEQRAIRENKQRR